MRFLEVDPPGTYKVLRVTRVEVIDHRLPLDEQRLPHVYSAWGCDVDLSFQDDGRTLKVFISGERKKAIEVIREVRSHKA